MASHRARDDLDDFLETIDLTCSSPEPEPEPAPRSTAPSSSAKPKQRVPSRPAPAPAHSQSQQQQQQYHHHQQHTLRPPPTQTPSRLAHHHHPYARQSASRTPAVGARHVDPQHVARILESSDVRAIRHVVLTLCRASPALFGAAPYISVLTCALCVPCA
jgi:hypothetical protein